MHALAKQVPLSSNYPAVSVRAKSISELEALIISNGDIQQRRVDALIIQRTNTAMNIGYQINLSAEERGAVIEEYLKVLRVFPLWAVEETYNVATREIPRRATPAELATLANRARKLITDELGMRKNSADLERLVQDKTEKTPATREAAEQIMQLNGFTVKRFGDIQKRPRANTWAEVDSEHDANDAPNHWSTGKTYNSEEVATLRATRAANPIMAAAIAEANALKGADLIPTNWTA